MNDDGADEDGPDLTPDELAALLAQEPLTAEVFAAPVTGDGIRGDTLLPTAGQKKRGYASEWSPYTGPHGGRGIKNNSTGEIRYGEDVPVDRPKSQDSPTTPRPLAAPADSSPRATIAELEKTTGGVGAIEALKAAEKEHNSDDHPAIKDGWKITDAGGRYEKDLGDGIRVSSQRMYPDAADRWNVQFYKDVVGGKVMTTTKLTGDSGGAAVGIMRKIGSAVDSFVDHQKPAAFKFAADEDEPSRVKLYDRISRIMADRHGYDMQRSSDGNQVTYQFTRKESVA